MSQIINTNRAVRVKFDAHTVSTQTIQSSSASIYVSFPAKEIIVKGVDLDFVQDFRSMYFTSSLVDNNILGSGFAGGLCDYSSSTKQLRYIFNTPRDINGSFRFDYSLIDVDTQVSYNTTSLLGAITTWYGAPAGYALFVLEFIGSTNL